MDEARTIGALDRRLEAAGLALVAATMAALLIIFVLTLRTDAAASTVAHMPASQLPATHLPAAHLTAPDAPAGASGDAE